MESSPARVKLTPLPNLKEAIGQTSTVIIMGCVGIAGFLLTQFAGFETRDVSITETEHIEPVVLPAPVNVLPERSES